MDGVGTESFKKVEDLITNANNILDELSRNKILYIQEYKIFFVLTFYLKSTDEDDQTKKMESVDIRSVSSNQLILGGKGNKKT